MLPARLLRGGLWLDGGTEGRVSAVLGSKESLSDPAGTRMEAWPVHMKPRSASGPGGFFRRARRSTPPERTRRDVALRGWMGALDAPARRWLWKLIGVIASLYRSIDPQLFSRSASGQCLAVPEEESCVCWYRAYGSACTLGR